MILSNPLSHKNLRFMCSYQALHCMLLEFIVDFSTLVSLV